VTTAGQSWERNTFVCLLECTRADEWMFLYNNIDG